MTSALDRTWAKSQTVVPGVPDVAWHLTSGRSSGSATGPDTPSRAPPDPRRPRALKMLCQCSATRGHVRHPPASRSAPTSRARPGSLSGTCLANRGLTRWRPNKTGHVPAQQSARLRIGDGPEPKRPLTCCFDLLGHCPSWYVTSSLTPRYRQDSLRYSPTSCPSNQAQDGGGAVTSLADPTA